MKQTIAMEYDLVCDRKSKVKFKYLTKIFILKFGRNLVVHNKKKYFS